MTPVIDLEGPLEGLRYERRADGIAIIAIDRPNRANALAPKMMAIFKAIWEQVRDDDAIRVAIITSTGERHFCTGFDVAEADGDDAGEVFINRPLAAMSASGRKQTLVDTSLAPNPSIDIFRASECPLTTQSGHSRS